MKTIPKVILLILGLFLITGLIYFETANVNATPSLLIDKKEDQTSNTPALYAYKLLDQQKLALKQGGWLYLKMHRMHDIDADNFGTFPNGQKIPTESIQEGWYYVNQNGVIERSVFIETAMNGDIVQVGVYSDGTSWNTAVDEVTSRAPSSFSGIDFGLQSDLSNKTLTMTPFVENNKQLLKYSVTVNEEKHPTTGEYNQPLTEMKTDYIFDQSTGFLIRYQQTALLEDGRQRIFDLADVDMQIGIEPPPYVMSYFDKKQERVGSK
jgi:hypothetical protein